MAIKYVGGTSSSANGSTSTGITLSLTSLSGGIDTAARTGDIVIASVASGSRTERTIGVTTNGYTQIANIKGDDVYDTYLSVNYKIMGETPDTSIVTTPSGYKDDSIALLIHVWRGVDTSNPLDVATTTATGSDTGEPNPPAITPTTTGSVVISTCSTPLQWTYTQSEFSNFIQKNHGDTNGVMVGMGSYSWLSGTFDPAKWGALNNDNVSWAAVTLALRPTASGPANLKSFDTNLKANIKSIDGNLIANVKSLDTNV